MFIFYSTSQLASDPCVQQLKESGLGSLGFMFGASWFTNDHRPENSSKLSASMKQQKFIALKTFLSNKKARNELSQFAERREDEEEEEDKRRVEMMVFKTVKMLQILVFCWLSFILRIALQFRQAPSQSSRSCHQTHIVKFSIHYGMQWKCSFYLIFMRQRIYEREMFGQVWKPLAHTMGQIPPDGDSFIVLSCTQICHRKTEDVKGERQRGLDALILARNVSKTEDVTGIFSGATIEKWLALVDLIDALVNIEAYRERFPPSPIWQHKNGIKS